jgi:hypothetical protein
VTPTEHGPWQPLSPAQVGTLLRSLRAPWWIAGGWALDLFAGRQTRDHADLDVEVLRRDQMEVRRCLAGWDLHTAASGVLRPWPPGEPLGDEIHSIWCRPAQDAPWALQIMFAEARGGDWVYRRVPTITRPLGEVGLRTPDGLPYIAPEIQLLYKAKSPRPKDDADFSMVLPLLNSAQSHWLARALTESHPDHNWLSQISAAI